jgi:hypothetical protein
MFALDTACMRRTMTGGPLRRLQELAAGIARRAQRLFASAEGGEYGGPPVRVQLDTTHSVRPSGYGPKVQRRRRRAVPKMLRMISVPAVRANCLKALESVICSTIDFSARCGLRDRARLAARASRSA